MEEDIYEINKKSITISNTFKKIQSKKIFTSIPNIDFYEEFEDNYSKDFENNSNNSYNIDKDVNMEDDFTFEKDANLIIKNIEIDKKFLNDDISSNSNLEDDFIFDDDFDLDINDIELEKDFFNNNHSIHSDINTTNTEDDFIFEDDFDKSINNIEKNQSFLNNSHNITFDSNINSNIEYDLSSEDKFDESINSIELEKDFLNNSHNIYSDSNIYSNIETNLIIEENIKLKTQDLQLENLNNERNEKINNYNINLSNSSIDLSQNDETITKEKSFKFDIDFNLDSFEISLDTNNSNEYIDNKINQSKSKSNFNIGNINHKDYNDEIIPNTLVDSSKTGIKQKDDSIILNEKKSFYELNLEDMPDRTNLLKELYKDELNQPTKENGENQSKSNILGKLFKRSEK